MYSYRDRYKLARKLLHVVEENKGLCVKNMTLSRNNLDRRDNQDLENSGCRTRQCCKLSGIDRLESV